MSRPRSERIPVELVADAETEAMLAALQNARGDVGIGCGRGNMPTRASFSAGSRWMGWRRPLDRR